MDSKVKMPETFGERVSLLRKVLGKTQKELADDLGTTRSNVASLETRKGKIQLIYPKMMHLLYGIEVQWLLTGEGSMWERSEALDDGSEDPAALSAGKYGVPEGWG